MVTTEVDQTIQSEFKKQNTIRIIWEYHKKLKNWENKEDLRMKTESNNTKKLIFHPRKLLTIKITQLILHSLIETVMKTQKQKQLMTMARRKLQKNTFYHCRKITEIQYQMIILIIDLVKNN